MNTGSALLTSVLCPFALAGEAVAGDLVGRVVKIADGDTLTILVSRQQIKVRQTYIDAPELWQTFGHRSRQSLANLCALRGDIPSRYGNKGQTTVRPSRFPFSSAK